MPIKVFIKRTYPKDRDLEKDLFSCIREIRSLVPEQQGYVSSEYLKPLDNSNEITSISCWFSLEDWNVWLESNERKKIQDKIDNLQGVKTEYTIYRNIKTR